jgi:hydrogenase maturation factor
MRYAYKVLVKKIENTSVNVVHGIIILCNVRVLETPFGLLLGFITISHVRNYIHLKLFLTLLRVYTITILTRQYSILDVFTYSPESNCKLHASAFA